MAKYSIEDSTLTGIADAIREKEGTTDVIPVADFAARIAAIEGSGGGKKLSELTEGSLVSVLEDGKLVPFYVAKHNYEADLNGEGRTLLVRKEAHSPRQWNSSNVNAYANSTVDTWLNGEYKDSLSATVRAQIGATSFEYTAGNGVTTVSTLKKSVFLLSLTEFGISYTYANVEGSELPIASMLRPRYKDGVAVYSWTRSPEKAVKNSVFLLNESGALASTSPNSSSDYVTPCFTLPADMTLTEEPYGDGSWGLADEDILFDTETAKLTPLLPINYTSGIADFTPAQLNGIAMAISANPNITKDTSVVYYDNGDVHRKISVGDTMTFTYNDDKTYTHTARIIGFNHDDLGGGVGYETATVTAKAGMTFEMVECLASSYPMNSSNTNSGGWTSCVMRSTYFPIFITRLTNELQNAIKVVTKLTSAGSKNTAITTSMDTLFLLSEVELGGGSASLSASGEGVQYAYYAAGNSRIKKKDGAASDWWERSPIKTATATFCEVGTSGNLSQANAGTALGVAFCFCI